MMCNKHPKYQAKRRPVVRDNVTPCPICWIIWTTNQIETYIGDIEALIDDLGYYASKHQEEMRRAGKGEI